MVFGYTYGIITAVFFAVVFFGENIRRSAGASSLHYSSGGGAEELNAGKRVICLKRLFL